MFPGAHQVRSSREAQPECHRRSKCHTFTSCGYR
nr:MAG TPA: hypothetical protein [Caudoviricetes sp.]